MILGFVRFSYNKYNYLAFEINNETLGPLLHEDAFVGIDQIAKAIRLQILYPTGWQ